MTARAIIVGGARSGSGKTSVAIGLMRALRRRGLRVAGAKSGPDYIDPGFHAAATGRPGVNLDSWAMPPPLLDRLIAQQAADADLLVIESAMGLFDGVRGEAGRSGSAADLARRYAIPVLLVLDVSGQSQTAAAIAHGFVSFDPAVRIAGVVLNQVASERHDVQAREGIVARDIAVLGAIRRNPDMALPERHLRLVQAREHRALEAFIERLAGIAETSLDLDAILGRARPLDVGAGASDDLLPPPGQRIALADDAAFTFIYPHLARHWRAAGAELLPFSPLADEGPDASCDVCWLPGGYPELHAGKLAAAHKFKASLAQFAERKPVHGECGGYMVLGAALEDAGGVMHAMTGLLSHVTSFAQRKMNLGYRRARLSHDCAIGSAGAEIRGHEFHYSRLVDPGRDAPLAELSDSAGSALGPSGGRRGPVTGAYFMRLRGDDTMLDVNSIESIRALCRNLPAGNSAAAEAARARQMQLTKPPGSLGRLEEFAATLAHWQGRAMPRLDRVEALVFAGSHGIAARGISAFPADVTAQMVANFARGGAAINQLAKQAGVGLTVVPLDVERPTEDFTRAPAMSEAEFVAAVKAGFDGVPSDADLVCLGEMGIANTTVAAAVAAALFGGAGADWVGRGTGVDDAGLVRKAATVDAALAFHGATLADPLVALQRVGGRELAAIFGAALAARLRKVPVLLDGFVATAAAAPLGRIVHGGLAHALAGHVSAEAQHGKLLKRLGLTPILDLGMRLGEASGACLAVNVLRGALACHVGMATFAEAGVSGG